MSNTDIDDRIFEHVVYSPVCLRCANLHDAVAHTCRAFPDGIPWPIWDGKNDHIHPYEGDHGIQFVPHNRGARMAKLTEQVQSLIFDKEYFDRRTAIAWAHAHDFPTPKVHETGTSFRFRQFEPEECRGGYNTKEIAKGVSLVMCLRE